MSSPNRDEFNPYAPPTEVAQPAGDLSGPLADPTIVTKFRQQIHALGAFWIFIGSLALVLAWVGLSRNRGFIHLDNHVVLQWTIVVVAGTAWCVLGVLTCLKYLWAVYVGLVLSYASIPIQLLNLNLCGIAILMVVILQAHRVIGWAKRMQTAGIPLNTKP